MRIAMAATALAALLLSACAPAAPSPTTAPAKPAATQAPAKTESKPAATTAPAKPAATTAPKAETKPAAKATEKPAAKAETKAETKPAAKVDTKALEDFYKGKTIRIIVGFNPGGGFDTYSRTIGRHLGKHIPGNPNVIVENMPGASSRLAANHVYNVAPKDGTVIANFHGNLFMAQAFGASGIEFDANNFEFVGVPTGDRSLCIASDKSGFKSLSEIQNPNGKQMVVAGDAPGSTTTDVALILQEALDLNFKIVQGYQGTAKGRLAMENGEVDGMCGWSWESMKTSNYDDAASGKMVILTQVSARPIPDLPQKDVPLARDLAKTEESKQLIRYGIENLGEFNRPYLLPPGTPKPRVEAIRTAFMETFKDKDFLADAEKIKLGVDPVSGPELEQLVKDTLAMPADIKQKLISILTPSGS